MTTDDVQPLRRCRTASAYVPQGCSTSRWPVAVMAAPGVTFIALTTGLWMRGPQISFVRLRHGVGVRGCVVGCACRARKEGVSNVVHGMVAIQLGDDHPPVFRIRRAATGRAAKLMTLEELHKR